MIYEDTYLCSVCYDEHKESKMIKNESTQKFYCSNKCKYAEKFTLDEYIKNKPDQVTVAEEVCGNGTCGGGEFVCDTCSQDYNGTSYFEYHTTYESCDKKVALEDYISKFDYIESGFFKFIHENEHDLIFESCRYVCTKKCMTDTDWKLWDAIVKYHELYLLSL